MAPVNPTHDLLADTDHLDLDAELECLTAASRELLASLGGPAVEENAPAPADADEVALLRLENSELRARVQELEHLLHSSGSGDDSWADRQREYEALLEEKSEVIRALHQKIREQHDRPARSDAGPAQPSEEILQFQQELEDRRRQLEEDEEAMTAQLREMEMALSKDRADLARQRQEIQRLQADLAREIEMASRDPGLRERLMNLRRPGDNKSRPTTQVALAEPTPVPQATPPATVASKGSSGIFRRIFG